jgi:dienelactone hydrolase
MKTRRIHLDEEVRFTTGETDLTGIITHPASNSSHPGIVLLHGADRSGVEDPYYREHAERLVQSSFAVLRYDGPGWGGKPSEGAGLETLEYRTEEAIAAVRYMQSRPDIKSNAVGLWGFSQGGWICQMAASSYEGVAFIIPVSGPGVTPAEQEVYRVEAQTRAAGFDDAAVAKAVLMRRLMVDVVLLEPVYQALNQSETMRLGDSRWDEVVELVYSPETIDPGVELERIIELLVTINEEPWTEFLYLDQILSIFESIPPEVWDGAKAQMRAVMNVNPADFLTKVHCPVLALIGQDDRSLPVDRSVALYKIYLDIAGNEAVTIKVFPDASHSIHVGEEYAPGYFKTMMKWLRNLGAEE